MRYGATMTSYPAIGYSICGLDSAWKGPRWLHYFNASEAEVFNVVLAHSYQPRLSSDSEWFLVSSLKTNGRVHVEDRSGFVSGWLLRELLQITTPRMSRSERAKYAREIPEFIARSISSSSLWLSGSWTVDGDLVDARMFKWADAWGGYTLMAGSAICVISTKWLDGVSLVSLVDTLAYNFDAHSTIDFPKAIHRSFELTFRKGEASMNAPWPRHLDHLKLLSSD